MSEVTTQPEQQLAPNPAASAPNVGHETGRPAFVYVFMHRGRKQFEIGQCGNLQAHIEQLDTEQFTPSLCMALEFASVERASVAAATLGRLLSPWRRDANGSPREPGTRACVEVYSRECYGAVRDFVWDIVIQRQASYVKNLRSIFQAAAASTPAALRVQRAQRLGMSEEQEIQMTESEIAACWAQIEGPIRHAFDLLNATCMISVRDGEVLFVHEMKYVYIVRKALWMLDGLGLSVSQTRSRVRIFGKSWETGDLMGGKQVRRRRLEFLPRPEDDPIEGAFKRRLVELFESRPIDLSQATADDYHDRLSMHLDAECEQSDLSHGSHNDAQHARAVDASRVSFVGGLGHAG